MLCVDILYISIDQVVYTVMIYHFSCCYALLFAVEVYFMKRVLLGYPLL